MSPAQRSEQPTIGWGLTVVMVFECVNSQWLLVSLRETVVSIGFVLYPSSDMVFFYFY